MFLKSLLACLSSRAVLSYGCSCIYKGKSGYICEGERCNGKELGREREREREGWNIQLVGLERGL